MKKESTAIRLKKIMSEKNLRQVDVLELAKPYCLRYGLKIGKSDLSQYCSGKTEPQQDKLFILGCALNVSEGWLMGFDVSPERKTSDDAEHFGAYAAAHNEKRREKIISMNLKDSELSVIEKYRTLDQHGKELVNVVLNAEYDRCKSIPEIMKDIDPAEELKARIQEGEELYENAARDKRRRTEE